MRDGEWYIAEGTTVTGIKVIAEGKKIRVVDKLREKYPLENGKLTNAKDWYKVRATAILTNGEVTRKAEIHYYQCDNIGKVEFKVKRWIE